MSEIISAIIDNELKGKDFDVSLNELAKNSNALSKYRTYLMISDVINNEYLDVDPMLTSKIMSKINNEPTQFYNGFFRSNQSSVSFDYKKYVFVFALGLLIAFILSLATNFHFNSSSNNYSVNEILASDDISLEIIEDHFSITTRNPNYYLEAGYHSNI
jgi:hypothetical protein